MLVMFDCKLMNSLMVKAILLYLLMVENVWLIDE